MAKTTEAIPLASHKSKVYFRKISWLYNRMLVNEHACKYNHTSPIQPAKISINTGRMMTQAALTKCRNSETLNAFALPSHAGMEYNFCDLSNSSSCNA